MSSPIETAPPQSSTILIIEVNKNDEYVEIANVGSEPQDLTGWTLLSENGGQTCTLDGVLDPEQTLRIWALAEDAAEEGHNCGFDGDIWNNSEEDLAILFDAMGQEVDRK
jgi:competence protein ComEC